MTQRLTLHYLCSALSVKVVILSLAPLMRLPVEEAKSRAAAVGVFQDLADAVFIKKQLSQYVSLWLLAN